MKNESGSSGRNMHVDIRVSGLARGDKEKIEDLVREEFPSPHLREILVCDKDHANEEAEKAILGHLWSFKAQYIAEHCKPQLSPAATAILASMVANIAHHSSDSEKQGANELIRHLIHDERAFVRNAIKADGRGHFLSFSGGETEVTFKGKKLLAYVVRGLDAHERAS